MAEIIQPAPPPHLPGWTCLPCIIDRKVADMNAAAPPEPREAITMMNGMLVCYEHIAVQQQSPLAVPGPAAMPMPAGLMGGR